jgi:hypothetical protein
VKHAKGKRYEGMNRPPDAAYIDLIGIVALFF